MSGRGVICPACRQRADWSDYFCPVCGAHHDALYRADHPDPAAQALTRADIEAEYAAEGIPFRHNPALSAGASAHLQNLLMQRTRRRRAARAT